MKVLMTADTVGGVWTYALELAGALEPHGVEIALATMGAPLSADQWRDARACGNVSVHESAYKLEWMDDPWEDAARAGDWLLELERDARPDVVHLNGFVHGDLPWRTPTLVVGHSCVLSWWRAVKGEDAPPEWGRYRDAVARGLRAADRTAAPTAAMLRALETHYGALPRPTVLPNARSGDAFAPAEKEPFVFAAGRLWDEAKNVGALAAVAPSLAWPVCVAGDAAHPDGGVARHEGVRLLGRLAPDEVARCMGRASIYCLPARYEPFGLSALEAGLAGCALVLGDIPTLREVWGDAARFVPPDDTAALQDALQNLIADAGLRRDMAERARRRAGRYTPSRMAAAYLETYRGLIGVPKETLACV